MPQMEPNNNKQTEDSAHFFAEIKFLEAASDFTENMLCYLETIDNRILDTMKPYLLPRKNILSLIEFYNVFEHFNSYIKQIKIFVRQHNLEEDSIEIEDLEKCNFLKLISDLDLEKNKLVKYKDVKIATALIKESDEIFELLNLIVKNAVFNSLNRLPKVVENLDSYSQLLLKGDNSNEFIKKFTEICLDRLGFAGIESNFQAILQRTRHLTEDLNMVISFNRRILGKNAARTVNDGLIKLMVLDLKKILIQALEKINSGSSFKYLPFLCNMHIRLNHGEGNMVKEIEDLFPLKKEILTLIFNCFIDFFMNVDLLKQPNSDLNSEELVDILCETLKLFKENKTMKKLWVDEYGQSFGVRGVEEMNLNFINKTYYKLYELSKKLDIAEKSIYLVNNLDKFKPFVEKVDEKNLEELVLKNLDIIVGMWQIKLESLTESSFYENILKYIEESRQYSLPEHERSYISIKILGAIQNMAILNNIKADKKHLQDEIKKIYSKN